MFGFLVSVISVICDINEKFDTNNSHCYNILDLRHLSHAYEVLSIGNFIPNMLVFMALMSRVRYVITHLIKTLKILV